MLEIKQLTFSRIDGGRKRFILQDLSLSVQQGESLAILGDSGSGKSTILHLISGLISAERGQIRLAGNAIHHMTESQRSEFRKSHLGIVFQQFNLLECLTVEQNIRFPARLNKLDDTAWYSRLVKQLNIAHLATKMPLEISGGEQQRVAVARALSHKPKLVLADEPTGNLDTDNANRVVELLINTCKSLDTALILVTHSMDVSHQTDRVLKLVSGQLHHAN